MNALVADASHRARVLRALGVTPWRRVTRVADTAAAAVESARPGSTSAVCAVLLPKGCSARELDLLGRALYAFGPELARAARMEVGTGELTGLPVAQAYLVFGEPQAHALGRALSADAMRTAHIVLADVPADVLNHSAAKRRLWHALRGLRRALATTTVS